jgi:hypothetical protein
MKSFAFALLLVASPAAFANLTCTTNINPTGMYQQAVGAGNLTGCLQAPTGLTPDPAPTPWGTAYIAWQITPTATGYQYNYTFFDPSTEDADPSHLIVGLSARCGEDPNCITNVQGADVNATSIATHPATGSSQPNPGMPGDLYGIKLDTKNDPNPFSFSFHSNRIPVWQNFYAKKGKDIFLYNAGFGVTGVASYFLAAPDSVVVPEPGFYGMLAAGLTGLYLAVQRRKRQA